MLRIGTRASKLALIQANMVKEKLLTAVPNLEIEIVPIKTTGDKIQHKNLYDIGGKGLFIKELEEALLAKKIDIAVHSLKDVPGIIADELEITAVLKREDPRDAFLANNYTSILQLPPGAIIGTCSPRRMVQIKLIRPDLNFVTLRGNIDTRISRLVNGNIDATILAVAGLKRLNINPSLYTILSKDEMLPAIGQGAIAVQALKDNENIRDLSLLINEISSFVEVSAERSFLKEMQADCNSPLAAYATITSDQNLYIRCFFASQDGKKIWRSEAKGSANDAVSLGKQCALEIKNSMK